jgi:hypothetical protein
MLFSKHQTSPNRDREYMEALMREIHLQYQMKTELNEFAVNNRFIII